ncbi:MAG: L-seryl-tRNA(Ser) seleniumtransferase [bacterium]|nr:MAG: L-seryl-tRNA(Ser) seleniumtransferase [bacterium]
MKERDKQRYLKMLPSVDRILQQDRVKDLLDEYPRWLVLRAVQQVIEEERIGILSSDHDTLSEDGLSLEYFSKRVSEIISTLGQLSLRKVINATGVILHTNLGRSLLNLEVLQNLITVASNFSNLEYDLKEGKRGSRYSHVENILCELTGAEAALVVNNNAGAVLLALNSIARLVEVGTTNKTHLIDYRRAITNDTALLLKVHTSNFQIVGFTSEVKLEELVYLGREFSVPVMEDLGSGCMIDLDQYGLTREPTVQEAISKGVDVVTFSGDKLLGGPQAGIILGREEVVGRIKENPLNRALRIDKLTLAALESTLRIYMEGERAVEGIPTLRMLTMPLQEIEKRAKSLYRRLRKDSSGNFHIEIKDDNSKVGGGALPLQDLPTKVISIKPVHLSVEGLEEGLRNYNPPIIARIDDARLLLDVRTLQEGEPKIIEEAIKMLTVNR